MTCVCGHGVGMHDLNKANTRTACSVLTGPRGVACGCTSFQPTNTPSQEHG